MHPFAKPRRDDRSGHQNRHPPFGGGQPYESGGLDRAEDATQDDDHGDARRRQASSRLPLRNVSNDETHGWRC